MASSYELSARGKIFADIFTRADDHLDRDEWEESKHLCHLLLDYPNLSEHHKAGCHHILSFNDDNFL
jgi:hypothetical protein